MRRLFIVFAAAFILGSCDNSCDDPTPHIGEKCTLCGTPTEINKSVDEYYLDQNYHMHVGDVWYIAFGEKPPHHKFLAQISDEEAKKLGYPLSRIIGNRVCVYGSIPKNTESTPILYILTSSCIQPQ